MCLRRAPEKYITGAKAPAGAALDRAALTQLNKVGAFPNITVILHTRQGLQGIEVESYQHNFCPISTNYSKNEPVSKDIRTCKFVPLQDWIGSSKYH
jgi:hypothetical protein